MADDPKGGPATAEPKGEKETVKDTEKVLIRRSPKQTEINVTDTYSVHGTDAADDLAAQAGAVAPPKPADDAAASHAGEQPPASRPYHPNNATRPAQPSQPAANSASTAPNQPANQPPASGGKAGDQTQPPKGQPTGSSAKGVTDSPGGAARQAEQQQLSVAARLRQRRDAFLARFKGGEAKKALLQLLAKNPLTWEIIFGIVVAIVAVVAVVIAVYLITCTYKGTCTGTDGTTRNANVGNDRDAILINLAKQGDRNSTAQFMRDNQQEVILALGRQKAAEPKQENKDIIQRLIAAVGALKGSDYKTEPLAAPLKKQKEEALAAYAAYQKIGGVAPEVRKYMNFANAHGSQLETIGDVFLTGRPGRYHLGYDMYGPPGSTVVVGWDGKVTGVGNYDASYAAPGALGQAVWVESEVGGEKYSIVYGHITVDSGIKVGQTVKAGDKVGVISPLLARPHLDSKWKRINGNVWVDWGRVPYKTVAELTQ